jgi:hypothetical protein
LKKANGKAPLGLTDPELAYLQEIHVASALKQLTELPGWEIYTKIVADMVERMENQHLDFGFAKGGIPTRDAYWVAGVGLGYVREFAKMLTERIAQKVDILNQPLRAPKPVDPADYDGENRNGQEAEGE